MAAPFKKAKALKLISGTVNTTRDREETDAPVPEYKPLFELPPPPINLSAHGVIFWNHYGEMMIGSGVLTVGDLGTFHQLTLAWSELMQNADHGFHSPASLHMSLISLWSHFGLTPASRSKLKIGSEKPKRNEFDED